PVRAAGILAERAGAGTALALPRGAALVAVGYVPGPRGPAHRIVTVSLIPGIEGRRAVVDVACPGIALKERQLTGDYPAARRVVGSGDAVFAEHAAGAAVRPGSLAAAGDIGGVEIDGVVRHADVLGLPQAAVPPVHRRRTGASGEKCHRVGDRGPDVGLAAGHGERSGPAAGHQRADVVELTRAEPVRVLPEQYAATVVHQDVVADHRLVLVRTLPGARRFPARRDPAERGVAAALADVDGGSREAGIAQ